MKKEKPILFSGEMVRAILDGRKTQTRRVIKGANSKWAFDSLSDCACITGVDKRGNEYAKDVDGLWACFEATDEYYTDFAMFKSKYQVGDILWVRETWCWDNAQYKKHCGYNYCSTCIYEEDGACCNREKGWYFEGKKPSIHMPKEAARIFLRVADVRVERLQDIGTEDAKAEGVNWVNGHNVGWEEKMKRTAIDRFHELWDRLNAKRGYGWDANPWVWVITFERIDRADETER